ncbi:MAG: NADH-quinone oxidoreductase subunit J [Vicinamibacteria bacterium]
MILDVILFYSAAIVALISGIYVVAQRNPINSAFSLIITMCSLAVMFAMLGSGFIAVLQVVVYAGAIMVLFLFVIMLLNTKQDAGDRAGGIGRAAIVLGMILAIQSVMMVWKGAQTLPTHNKDTAAVEVARGLFSSPRFLYPFEATSILILSAMVGAIVVARKEKGK